MSARLALADGTASSSIARPVRAGDQLHITIYEWVTPGLEWAKDFEVSKDGCIQIEHIGNLRIAGLTPQQIVAKIQDVAVNNFQMLGAGPPPPQVTVEIRCAIF